MFVFRPFIGTQDHGLREIQRAEFGIDRHGEDCAGKRDVLGFETRTFRAKQDRAASLRTGDLAARFLGRDDRLGDAALAHGGSVDMRAIGHGFGRTGIDLRPVEDDVGSGRGGAGGGIGPSVARFDQTHFSKAEIEHGARRLADVLAQLRAHQHDDRLALVSRAHGWPLPVQCWQRPRSRGLR